MFSDKDIQQIKNKGITVDEVNAQVTRLKDGMTFSNLEASGEVLALHTFWNMRLIIAL